MGIAIPVRTDGLFPWGHEHLQGRSAVADRGMRVNHIVMTAPTLDDDLGSDLLGGEIFTLRRRFRYHQAQSFRSTPPILEVRLLHRSDCGPLR